ncbi:MAG TPA: AmmeMemoRadiSam system protein B [Nitrosopumilaceae archaeon]|nr:AmmeMemoRadiSam system protein B [Nitrosopumilaceae archaeon]
MPIRTPAVAGMFYPKETDELRGAIHHCFFHHFGPGKNPPIENNEEILGVISPHAGYMYSGPIAANSFYHISSQKPELVIIIGPNHWGIGCNVAVMKEGQWQTPLGDIEVDTESSIKLNEISKIAELDFFSHTKDHSLEVQVPMLQEIYSHKFKILPIILIDQGYKTANEIGKALAKIAKTKKSVIIGSSDFTHYEENSFAYKQDKLLIAPILDLDVDRFYDVLQENQITACGFGAIASTMVACKELGASKGTLLKYATSGDVAGDKSSVVGYASIAFS